jgi:DNA polymerase-4
MPGFRARQLCPVGVFLPANMSHYAAVSAEVHGVFARFTPLVEPLALDEAFLDITGSTGLFGGPLELAQELKRAVWEETALTVSVGLADTLLVAKIACTLGKPDGLRLVRAAEVRALLDPLPIRRLWGVGPALGARLGELGIRTFADLVAFDPERLTRAIGARAPELQSLARGIDARTVEADRAPKSYGEENTFEQDVLERARVTATLTGHAEAVARRLRKDRYRGRTVTLKIKLGRARGTRIARDFSAEPEPRYPLLTRSQTLAKATDDGAVIRRIAVGLWDAARIQEPVRLLGISVSNLEAEAGEQLELFSSPRDRLGSTLDAIAERFGPNAITRAAEAPPKVTPGSRIKRGER